MSLRTSEEEKLLSERKDERKKVFQKFKSDFLYSFLIGIRMGAIILVAVIIIYLIAKYLLNWDLFYETDLDYDSIVFVFTIMLFALTALFCSIAFILYNTKHKRNTKYKYSAQGDKK